MKKLLLILLILAPAYNFSQQKYMIYFTDKGDEKKILAKGSPQYDEALSGLTPRSIERRMKVLGNNFITYEDIPVNRNFTAALENSGIKIENTLKWFNAVSAWLSEEQVSLLKNLAFVEKIEPVRIYRLVKDEYNNHLNKSSGDSSVYGSSYTQLRLSDIPQVHRKNITGEGVLLGILDTGFKWKTHEAIKDANVLHEYDFIFKDNITENQVGDGTTQHDHGTSVFSVISGKKDSVLIGSAYGAEFLLAKTEDVRSETQVEEDNYAAALEWMESLGVDVTTSSLGYSEFDNFSYSYNDMDGKTTLVTKAAEIAFQRGVLVIASAGNEGNTPWHFITAPADGINVIAVGSVNSNNILASYSGRGPSSDGRIKPDVTAMGVSVFGASASGVNRYGFYGGTSLAAPVAAGAAALLLSAHPYLSNIQLRDIIIKTAGNYSLPNNDKGYGLISAGRAVEYPNLQQQGTSYLLHKVFLDDTTENVKIFYSIDTSDFSEESLLSDGISYTFELPVNLSNRVINFYYTYSDASGNTNRAPENGNYSLRYGDLTSIKIEDGEPTDYVLSYNYPNPFNSSTRINFYVNDISDVELNIYDLLGQKVRTLYKAADVSGEFSVLWNGRTDNGVYCSSGIYIYRLNIGGNETSKKMMLLK